MPAPPPRTAPPAPGSPAPAARARLQMLAAAALFSTGGSVIKATSLTGWQVAMARSGVAALALLALAPAARRAWSWRTPVVGVAYASTLLLFVQANKLTTAANAIFLQATAPLYLLLLSPWLLGERVRRRDLGFLMVLAGGLALFFVGGEAPTAKAEDPALGNLLAALSGLTWAFTIAGLRWLARGGAGAVGSTAVPATVAGNLLGCLVAAPLALPLAATPLDLALVAFLGVFQIALAYLCLTASVTRVPAFEGALLLLLEPVLSALLAWALHGETPAPAALAGAALILGATVAHAAVAPRQVEEAAPQG